MRLSNAITLVPKSGLVVLVGSVLTGIPLVNASTTVSLPRAGGSTRTTLENHAVHVLQKQLKIRNKLVCDTHLRLKFKELVCNKDYDQEEGNREHQV